jgi:hypothetical protein
MDAGAARPHGRRIFDKQLCTTLRGEPERELDRAQVWNALFLQLLVGMNRGRTGVNALLMGLLSFAQGRVPR